MEDGKTGRFEVINGGRTDNEKNNDNIYKDLFRQDELTPQQKADLAQKIRERKEMAIRESIAKFSGKILNDEEITFIMDRLLGLIDRDQKTIEELKKKFPELSEYFDYIITGTK